MPCSSVAGFGGLIIGDPRFPRCRVPLRLAAFSPPFRFPQFPGALLIHGCQWRAGSSLTHGAGDTEGGPLRGPQPAASRLTSAGPGRGLPELALPIPQSEEDRALSRAEVLKAVAVIPLVEPWLCSVGAALRATRRFLSVPRCRLSVQAGCVPRHMLDEVTSGKCRKPTTFWVLDTWFSWICQQVKSVRRREKKASVLFIEGNMNPKGRG